MRNILICLIFLLVAPPVFAQSTHTVSRVIDGNTLELTDGEQVRLIGVDCPEFEDQERNRRNAERLGIDPEHYGSYAQKAKDYLRRIEGAAVKLEYDEINESISHRDKYDRMLAYVYAYAFAKVREGLAPDGISEKWSDDQPKGNVMHLMNAKLIASGYGTAYTRFDFKHKDKFLELEVEAIKNEQGIWSSLNNPYLAWALCSADKDCVPVMGTCYLWTATNKNFLNEATNYYFNINARVMCGGNAPFDLPEPPVVCKERSCQPVLQEAEAKENKRGMWG